MNLASENDKIEANKMLNKLHKEVKGFADPKRAEHSAGYFKTGVGEYGYGDIFMGLTVPQCRIIALKFKDLSYEEIGELLHSKIHEERLIALLIMVYQAEHDEMLERRIYEFYLKNTKFVNNWDLVDLSAPKIVGRYLQDKPKAILHKLSKSKNIWEKRIAIIATFAFIKEGDFTESLSIAEELLDDENDLIQKAVGWTLREVGNKDKKLEVEFLNKHYKNMGRTALRYAIEKFPETTRNKYLKGKI